MKTVPIYQVDVFARKLFAGNPAAVCPLQSWLPEATMQAIAAENNLAETAFFVKDETGEADYLLRWFTPTVEIELCGHATLASGHVLLNELTHPRDDVRFRTLRAGVLSVTKRDGALWLDLPARMPQPLASVPEDLLGGLTLLPQSVLATGNKYFALYDDPADVAHLKPDMARLRQLEGMGVVVTAPGRPDHEDFVSRFFAPAMGVDEDPATGSAHCLLVPYWAQRLGKRELHATQLSPRGAVLDCVLDGERVRMSGPVRHYLRGEIAVPG
ncbi:MAG: PhzF family phenazine biosynthesis protein [Nevskiaceae bacterium]|nr:MAG: PhzF family phenazine biosynthesis protein [Nevskiaceae bacterium]